MLGHNERIAMSIIFTASDPRKVCKSIRKSMDTIWAFKHLLRFLCLAVFYDWCIYNIFIHIYVCISLLCVVSFVSYTYFSLRHTRFDFNCTFSFGMFFFLIFESISIASLQAKTLTKTLSILFPVRPPQECERVENNICDFGSLKVWFVASRQYFRFQKRKTKIENLGAREWEHCFNWPFRSFAFLLPRNSRTKQTDYITHSADSR